MTNPINNYKKSDKPLIFAHRGLVTAHQENTLSAVTAAMQSGTCNGTEIDIFLTKDNQLVLFHDEDFKRLTGDDHCIYDMTWPELQALTIKQDIETEGGLIHYPQTERIPLLSEVLEVVKGTDFILNIELKAHAVKWSRRRTGAEVAKLVRSMEMEDQVICVSFDFLMLHTLEKEHGGICSGYGYDDDMPLKTKMVNWLMEQNVIGYFTHSDCVMVENVLIDEDSIDKYHKRGMGVGVYTLFPLIRTEKDNEAHNAYHASEVKRLMRLDVDWITTDHPEKVYEIVYG
jgi:glycerophosphoryl diester phosphodiesterase